METLLTLVLTGIGFYLIAYTINFFYRLSIKKNGEEKTRKIIRSTKFIIRIFIIATVLASIGMLVWMIIKFS